MRRICTLLLLFILAFPVSGHAVPEVVDRIVAVVNGEIITLYELNKKLRPHLQAFRGKAITAEDEARLRAMQRGLLTKMVDELLILDEAKKLGLEAGDAEIENHIRSLKRKHNITEEDLQQQLKLERITRDEYKEVIREDLLRYRLLGMMVTRKVLVTEEEIREHYEANREKYAREREVRLGLILLPANAAPAIVPEDVRDSIIKGKISFAEAARQYSQGPGAEQGGDLGWLKWNELAPAWRESLEDAVEGDIGEPFDLGGRMAILSILESKGDDALAMEEVKAEIRGALHQPKFQRQYTEYMAELREKALIDIRL